MCYRDQVLSIIQEVINYYEDVDIKSLDEMDKVEFLKNIIRSYKCGFKYDKAKGFSSYKCKYRIISIYEMLKSNCNSSTDNNFNSYIFMSTLLDYLVLLLMGYDLFLGFGCCNITRDFIKFEMFNLVLFREYEFYSSLFLDSNLLKKIVYLSGGSFKKVANLIKICIQEYDRQVLNDNKDNKNIVIDIKNNLKNLVKNYKN